MDLKRKDDSELGINLVYEGEKLQKVVLTEGGNGEQFNEVFGASNPYLIDEIVSKGSQAVSEVNPDKRFNTLIQNLADYKPKNSMEARLCTQAHALFSQGMSYLSKAEAQDMMCHAEHYMKFALKLLRLHNETIAVLDKLRRGGEQKVVVQHVNVAGIV